MSIDSGFAKNVFMALAKKLSCSSVMRTTDSSTHKWRVLFENGFYKSSSMLCAAVPNKVWPIPMVFDNNDWACMLQKLEGKTIAIGSERIPVNSIEQLVVELELEGFLDIAQHVD